jgi:hypothetical protein
MKAVKITKLKGGYFCEVTRPRRNGEMVVDSRRYVRLSAALKWAKERLEDERI